MVACKRCCEPRFLRREWCRLATRRAVFRPLRGSPPTAREVRTDRIQLLLLHLGGEVRDTRIGGHRVDEDRFLDCPHRSAISSLTKCFVSGHQSMSETPSAVTVDLLPTEDRGPGTILANQPQRLPSTRRVAPSEPFPLRNPTPVGKVEHHRCPAARPERTSADRLFRCPIWTGSILARPLSSAKTAYWSPFWNKALTGTVSASGAL
jgi:hypothetical protein